MRVIGRAKVDRPEPEAPSRCDACQQTGNAVETREDHGVFYTVCVNVILCGWRKYWEGSK